ncbi:heterokaryon incompatibility protein-domain-containing protein [Xylogone sp. PMI_703]|nr:heterokaryon incompatibility protein-domain-containing protein [Xylogone sp. PMI_703]
MLCNTCQTLFTGDIIKPERVVLGSGSIQSHQASKDSLHESALKGCSICYALWHRFVESFSGAAEDTTLHNMPFTFYMISEGPGDEDRDSPDGTKRLIFTQQGALVNKLSVEDIRAYETRFSLLPASSLSLSSAPYNINSTANTGSDTPWKLAMGWLKECTTHHSKCNSNLGDPTWYPSRLLDVGLPSDSNVRLCVTKEEPPSGSYVTLSHCWGTLPIIQLKKSNITTFKNQIPQSELTRTFLEAIQVTRRLGIRYLWIDSLCILQGSDPESIADWQQEGPLMEKVYGNCFCCIAATGSKDGREGLFKERNVNAIEPVQVRSEWNGKQNQTYTIIDKALWNRNVGNAPLNCRAWVLQERVLSPRVLHFGKDQLLWECREKDACETFPEGFPSFINTFDSRFKGVDLMSDGKRLRIMGSGDRSGDSFNGYFIWRRMLEAYSKSALTREEDKLVAISGLVKWMEKVLNDTYIAGLWKKLLPSQLLWTVTYCQPPNRPSSYRPKIYRAPSWSWASVEGEISPAPPAQDGLLVQILEYSITPVTNDSTAQVKHGHLTASGSIFPMSIIIKDTIGTFQILGVHSNGHVLDFQQMTVHPDVPLQTKNENLFFLAVREYTYGEASHREGLILQQVSEGGHKTYSRFGTMDLRYSNLEDALLIQEPSLFNFKTPA